MNQPSMWHPEAERVALTTAIQVPDTRSIILDLLIPEIFHDPENRAVFVAIRDMHNAGKPIDRILLWEYMRENGATGRLRGFSKMTELADLDYLEVSHERIMAYCGILRKCLYRRYAYESAKQVAEAAQDARGSVEDMRLDLPSPLNEPTGPVTVGSLMGAFLAKIKQEIQVGATSFGVLTRFDKLDDTLDGFKPGRLYVLAARPGVGKTALALAIGVSAAAKGEPVTMWSLEMSREELGSRIACMASRVPWRAVRDKQLNPIQLDALLQANLELDKVPFFVDDQAGISMAELALRMKQRSREGRCNLAIVDYLQLVKQDKKMQNREQEVASITRDMKLLAKSLGIPILLLAQLNRETTKRAGGIPVVSDLRESGAIEQDADVVLLLYDGDEKKHAPGTMFVTVGKNRHGATGTIPLHFRAEICRFDPA